MATWCAVSWNVGGSADQRDCGCWERREIHDILWLEKSKTFNGGLKKQKKLKEIFPIYFLMWLLDHENWLHQNGKEQTGLRGLKIVKMYLDARAIRDEDKMECIFPALYDIKRYGDSREKISYAQRKKTKNRQNYCVCNTLHTCKWPQPSPAWWCLLAVWRLETAIEATRDQIKQYKKLCNLWLWFHVAWCSNC